MVRVVHALLKEGNSVALAFNVVLLSSFFCLLLYFVPIPTQPLSLIEDLKGYTGTREEKDQAKKDLIKTSCT